MSKQESCALLHACKKRIAVKPMGMGGSHCPDAEWGALLHAGLLESIAVRLKLTSPPMKSHASRLLLPMVQVRPASTGDLSSFRSLPAHTSPRQLSFEKPCMCHCVSFRMETPCSDSPEYNYSSSTDGKPLRAGIVMNS